MKTNNLDTLVVLGDIFDDRKKVSQKAEQVVLNFIEQIKKIGRIILLCGNHDIYYKDRNQPNWLKKFRDTDVIVVDEDVYIEEDCAFLAWNCPVRDFKTKYLFGHLEINGFSYNNIKICQTGLPLDEVKNYKMVLSGHFHKQSFKNNVLYLGSPYQMDFGDVGDVRGYYIFDNGDIRFIRFKDAPEFVKFDNEIDFNRITGNFVKVIFDNKIGVTESREIIEKIEALDPLSININFVANKFSLSDVHDNLNDDMDYSNNKNVMIKFIDKYAYSLPKDLDINLLKKIAVMLLEEMEAT
jgi:DNA repair exonuclease SbcCD nuclease subunit